MTQISSCFVLFIIILCFNGTFSKPRLTPRIYGGSLGNNNQFPFMVSIRAKENFTSYSHICGGTILSSRLVLTATHCTVFNGPVEKEYRVYVGSKCKSDGDAYEVKRFIKHPASDVTRLQNDLMFIELEKSIKFSSCIQPVAFSREILQAGVQVFALGFGISNVR